MARFDFRQKPFRLYGVPFFDSTGKLERVPEDVAVSGFDNNIEDLLAENLTTVQVFNEELGSRLALQILYRIKYPHTPHEVTYLESKVLYRASTGD